HRALCRLRDQLLVLAAEPGGADDVHEPLARRELGEDHRGGGNGEVDEPVGLFEQRFDLGRDGDAVLAQSRQLAGVPADHRRSPPDPGAPPAPATTAPSIAVMAWMSVRPMRPPAPATISRISDIGSLPATSRYVARV